MEQQLLVVFGATGTTGGHMIRQALDAGLSVRAAVRSPDKLPRELVSHERVDVMLVDITNGADVARAVQGADMVFVALGYKGQPAQPLLLPFVQQVVRAMRAHGVRRLVYQASGMSPVPGQPDTAYTRCLRRLARPVAGWAFRVRALWAEHDAVIRFLSAEADELDWVVTRPGKLGDDESRGALVVSDTPGGGVSNRDLAAFALEALRTGAHARSGPYLRYR